MAGYGLLRGGPVRDAAALKAYNEVFTIIAQHHGAEIFTGQGQAETVEGPAFPRQLILRFGSHDAASVCYRDVQYQASLALAARAYDCELSIFEGAV
jgi:uncharacterized protein (DUF1330 family)